MNRLILMMHNLRNITR